MTMPLHTSFCRRQAMLAAVATAVLMLTASPAARAQDAAPPAQEMADSLLAGTETLPSRPAVSAQDLAKAKAEVEAHRALPDEERIRVLYEQKLQQGDAAGFEERKARHHARKAYIDSLPEAERTALRDQMTSDRKAVRQKMKERWDAMTPEQRTAEKARRKAAFDALPDDVKQKMRDHRKQPRHGFDKKHMGKHPDGQHPDSKAATPHIPVPEAKTPEAAAHPAQD